MTVAAFVLACLALVADVATIVVLRRTRRVMWSFEVDRNGRDHDDGE